MADFILHAGLHKTATTSLQEQVFPELRQVFYTGKSRQVMSTRKSSILSRFMDICGEQPDALNRLPLHTCIYYLSLLQDLLISQLARSKASLDKLKPSLSLMQSLVKRIDKISENPTILYSCEGLLLCLGHLFPEKSLHNTDQAPLFLNKHLFPGEIRKVIIYVRSPIDYLFSRYIQIHTVRLRVSKDFTMTPLEYLDIQSQLFTGGAKCQSVFYHIFQQELRQDLLSLGIPVAVRSYEKHIRDSSSISREIKKTFDLHTFEPHELDLRFKKNHFNTTDRDKDEAINLIISHMGLSGRDQLKQVFQETAEHNDLVQAAHSSKIYPY